MSEAEKPGGTSEGLERTEGLVRHEEPGFGYAVTVPAVFVGVVNTVDPLARHMRGLDHTPPDEESKLSGRWPLGFADPEVVGDVGKGHMEPLRLFEFDVLGRQDPLDEARLTDIRASMRDAMPEALASLGLAGFELVEVRDGRLGSLDALLFEYEWAGPSERGELRDRGLVVWAPTPAAVYLVYHHCPADVWDAWLPELARILESFELAEPKAAETVDRTWE